MATLTNTKTPADIAIILFCSLFIILLIVGITLVSVVTIAFSFIIGGIGYAIAEYEGYKDQYEALEN